jgi:hypothetical protein
VVETGRLFDITIVRHPLYSRLRRIADQVFVVVEWPVALPSEE